ncbi:hypothetical protein B296_00031974 [Ensete ventricosum]|uniref:Uncharacterized protein n=1 Tax=Ensete ventricosum TaxID=4639 RepID=A0A427A1V7_ENSVE|nr:hypothetical protein B296_00031974 [Ensete ventricosum]
MSQERSTAINPGEDDPPAMQPTSGEPCNLVFSPFVRRRNPAFPHPRVILAFIQRPWANSTSTEFKDPGGDS